MNDQVDPFSEALEQLAGIDLSTVAAVRFESLPPMRGGFEILEFKSRGRETKKGDRIFVDIKMRVIEVMSVADAAYESPEAREKLIGKTHVETLVIDPADYRAGLGRVKAFLEDIGYDIPVNLEALFKGAVVGFKFPGQIKHRANTEDKDRPYVNVVPLKQTAAGKIAV